MNDIRKRIAETVLRDNAVSGSGLTAEDIAGFIETPADRARGDLALPCFRLSKALRARPDAVAQALCPLFGGDAEFERVEAVGGYLNFFYGAGKYLDDLRELLCDSYPELSARGAGKTICIDFSSPNIAKRFHLGHLGTTAIGNSLRNIFKSLGYNVVAINYLGDWGTQFGKLIYAYLHWSNAERVKQRGIDELVDLYVRFCDAEKQDPSLSPLAREAFHELESGNAEYLDIWKYFKEISLAEYKKTYDLLGIDFDSWDGESFYTDKMPAVVRELREKGLLKTDNGAEIVDLSEFNMPPALILKSDGSTLYPTRDIAAAIWRKNKYDFDKCLYVTSNGQSLHFAQWFKVVELLGYPWAKDLVHVAYGTMSINGEKIASRTGNVVMLDDLLAKAIEKCGEILAEKDSSVADRDSVAREVGVGAVIFNALSNSRIKDNDFNWDSALSFEGNTGPYIQYTYARTASVLRRAGGVSAPGADYTPNGDETALIAKLSAFPEALERAAADYEPSTIARYALSVCAAFNQFYHNCRIIGAGGSAEGYRLALAAASRNILGRCLDLLGMARTEEI